jgi:hypothetical protein
MASINIVCNDNVGVSCTHNSSQMSFYIESKYTSDNTKLLKACLDQILNKFNPQEPYFFYSKDLSKAIRINISSNRENRMFVELWQTTYRLYKLKFVGITDNPVYFLCASSDFFSDVIGKLKRKWKICANGIFKYNNLILDINIPLEKYNLNFGCYSMNEIIFEKTEIPVKKIIKIKEENKLSETYINEKKIDDSKTMEILTTKKKKTKEKIPLPVKHALWAKYFGDTMSGICHCCKTTPIHSTNFDCGHILSEKFGGSVHLDNLKPICRTCNSSMGTQNMDDYMEKYGLDKLVLGK